LGLAQFGAGFKFLEHDRSAEASLFGRDHPDIAAATGTHVKFERSTHQNDTLCTRTSSSRVRFPPRVVLRHARWRAHRLKLSGRSKLSLLMIG
jgi:hypothetical protein